MIIGLEHAILSGTARLEAPAHVFAGFNCPDRFEMGAYSYALSHLTHIRSIGRYCSIADQVVFGHQEHPVDWLSTSSFTYDPEFMGRSEAASRFQPRPLPTDAKRAPIVIGNDVWVGFRSYIRRGVRLGDGCIVGAGAVVTRDVPPYAVVAGNPGRIVRYRFPPEVVAELLELQWWRYDYNAFAGVDPRDVGGSVRTLRRLVEGGLEEFRPEVLELTPERLAAILAEG